MIKVKKAVRVAHAKLPEIWESCSDKAMRLEGVILTDDSKFWKVTFSFEDPLEARYSGRDYKTVKLRAKDGKFFGARNAWLDEW